MSVALNVNCSKNSSVKLHATGEMPLGKYLEEDTKTDAYGSDFKDRRKVPHCSHYGRI